LISATTPTGLALRQVLSDLITDLPDLSLKLARRLAGLDVHYGRTDQHRLAGARVTATGDALLDGRAALVGSPGPALIEQAATAGIPVQPLTVDASAAVIRPDGYVWWATDNPDDSLPDLMGRSGGH
jgi:hypothetical protein